jgi:hypothetical protein
VTARMGWVLCVRPSRSRLSAWMLTLASVFASSPAWGHVSSIPHELDGVTLCVDEATIDLRFAAGGAPVEHAVRERLAPYLTAILAGSGVPHRREVACPADAGYLSLVLHVEPAEWFAPRASVYTLAVQVGQRRAAGASARADPPDAFDLSVEELYDERAVGIPAFVFLPDYLEAGLRELVVSWWLDRPSPHLARQPSAQPPAEPVARAVDRFPPLWMALSVAAAAAGTAMTLALRRGIGV